MNTDISNEDALLAAQKTQLTDELNTANQILQSIPSQLNQVNEMYSAITGYNERSQMDRTDERDELSGAGFGGSDGR